jgi:hypothetical protein
MQLSIASIFHAYVGILTELEEKCTLIELILFGRLVLFGRLLLELLSIGIGFNL